MRLRIDRRAGFSTGNASAMPSASGLHFPKTEAVSRLGGATDEAVGLRGKDRRIPMMRHVLAGSAFALMLAVGASAVSAQQLPGQTAAPNERTPADAERPGMMDDDARERRMERREEARERRMERREARGHKRMHRDRMHHARHPAMMRMMFVLIDTDGSQTLSLEEVLSVHERMFNYADRDGDGELTMQEARGFMRGMRPDRNDD